MESVSEGQSMQYIVLVCAMVDTKKYVSEFSATSLWTYRNDWGCARLSEHLLVFSRHASEVRFICALVDHYFVVVVKFILRCVCYCMILSLLYLCDMVEEGCGKTKDTTVTWLRSISFCWQLVTISIVVEDSKRIFVTLPLLRAQDRLSSSYFSVLQTHLLAKMM